MQVKKEDKKRSIVDSALRLIAEKGIDGVSTDEIARFARVGKGTIYVYFKSKDEILEAVVERIYSSFTEDVKSSVKNSKTFDEFIEMLVDRMFKDMELRGRILHMFHRSYKNYSKVYEKFKRDYENALRKAFEKFKKAGLKFETFYFVLTSFLMSSYMLSKDLGVERVRKIVKDSLRKIFK